MRNWRLRPILIFLSVCVLSVIVVVTRAQNSCPTVVLNALEAVDDNCDTLDRNSACYGFNPVNASFVSDVDDDFFANPADRAAVEDLVTLATGPLDQANGTWGVSVMKLQANLPNGIPGQAVTFVLMGETEVENAVAPDEAAAPRPTVDVSISGSANIRSGPGTTFNVVSGATAGEMLPADAISEDGAWVRVVSRERTGWLSRALLDQTDDDLADLTTIDPQQRQPMQAFYLRTNPANPICGEAPDVLMVQSPQNVEVDLTVNGVNVRLGSTVLMRQTADDVLEFVVVDGQMTFLDENYEPSIVVPENHRSQVCLDPPEDRGLDGDGNDQEVSCAPSPPEFIAPTTLGINWCELEGVPTSVLNYPVNLVCEGDPVPAAPANPPPADDTAGNCANFSLVSPLQPVDPRGQTFQWTAVEGAAYYILQFYDYQGRAVEVFGTENTAYSLNLGMDTSTGGVFSWEVRAYSADDQFLCDTGQSPRLERLADPDPPPAPTSTFPPPATATPPLPTSTPLLPGTPTPAPTNTPTPTPRPTSTPPPPFSVDNICDSFQAGVTWQNLPAGESLEIYEGYVSGDTVLLDVRTEANGSYLSSSSFLFDVGVRRVPGDQEYILGDIFCK